MFELLLSIGGFALALGGLVAVIFSAKRVVIATVVLVFLTLLTTVAVYRHAEHRARVQEVADEIRKHLGDATLTFDQLREDLFHADYAILTEAIELLVRAKQIGYTTLTMTDGKDRSFRVRAYYLPSNASTLACR